MELDDYQALVEDHRDRIYGFALYTLHSREDAEDITQEVLIRLWNHRHTLDLGRIGGWLGRVTRNACYDLARRRQVRSAVHPAGDNEPLLAAAASGAPGPERAAQSADFRARLQDALAALAEPYRSVVVLREIQGLTYREIADTLEKPMNTVKVYLHRGRRLLRQALVEVEPHVKVS